MYTYTYSNNRKFSSLPINTEIFSLVLECVAHIMVTIKYI